MPFRGCRDMPSVELIRSPWAEDFADFGRAVRSEAILAAPFIGAKPLEQLAALFNSDRPPQVELITNLAPDNLLHGTVDVAAIARFRRALPAVTIRNLTSLHAKAYVADENLAIITSGNMTQASLHNNQEYGVKITDPAAVRQIAAHQRHKRTYPGRGRGVFLYATITPIQPPARRPKMLQTNTVAELFQTAHHHHAQALELLDQGQLRDAAAQAWDAALTATNALLLAHTGQEPEDLRETDGLMWELFTRDHPSLRPFTTHFGALKGFLLMTCVHDCFCGMEEGLKMDVRGAIDYIKQAEKLAEEGPG